MDATGVLTRVSNQDQTSFFTWTDPNLNRYLFKHAELKPELNQKKK